MVSGKNTFIYILYFLFIISAGNNINAQSKRISDHNTIAWCNFYATVKLNEKWGLHSDIQCRRVDGISKPQQMLYRFGINYQPIPELLLRVGGAFVQTFPYGDYPLNAYGKKTDEYRTFELITISQKLRSFDLSHRFMLEQKWNGKFKAATSQKPDSWPLTNRARYMFRIQKPLNLKKNIYAAAYNELFVSFGKNVGENIFDQNRLTLMIGKKISKILRMEAGFLSQTQQLSREVNGINVIQYNKGLILNSYFTF